MKELVLFSGSKCNIFILQKNLDNLKEKNPPNLITQRSLLLTILWLRYKLPIIKQADFKRTVQCALTHKKTGTHRDR